MERQIAALQDRIDLGGQIGADSRDLTERLRVERRQRRRLIANGARGVAIGSNPEEIGLLADFQQVGDLVEEFRDFLVLHRRSAIRWRHATRAFAPTHQHYTRFATILDCAGKVAALKGGRTERWLR